MATIFGERDGFWLIVIDGTPARSGDTFRGRQGSSSRTTN
jgi:hypothetical protein